MKKIFIIIFILLFVNNIYGTILEEKTLDQISFGDIIVEKDQKVCKEYKFTFNTIDDKSTAYMQLFIKNYIRVRSGIDINLTLNQETINIKDSEILEKNIIELKNIQKNNNLEICVENNFLPRFIIDSKSLLGNYYVGKITEDDFYQNVPTFAYVNTMIPISLIVKNSGYDDLYVEVVNATDRFIYNSSLENVSGETSYKGYLKAQEKLVLDYFVKTDLNKSFASPYAKLIYTDRFGVEHEKTLKTQIINLIEQEGYLQLMLDTFKNIEPEKEYVGHLIIRNNSERTIENIYINHNFKGNLILEKTQINSLRPKEVKEVPFRIKTFKEGNYKLSFDVDYLVENKRMNVGSSLVDIVSENKQNKENTASIILITISIILFVWIVKI